MLASMGLSGGESFLVVFPGTSAGEAQQGNLVTLKKDGAKTLLDFKETEVSV